MKRYAVLVTGALSAAWLLRAEDRPAERMTVTNESGVAQITAPTSSS